MMNDGYYCLQVLPATKRKILDKANMASMYFFTNSIIWLSIMTQATEFHKLELPAYSDFKLSHLPSIHVLAAA